MPDTTSGSAPNKLEAWKPERVNLRGLFTELSKATVKVAVGGATGNWGVAVGAVPDAVAALTHVGTITESERAYVLVKRAMAEAVVELVGEKRGSFKPKEMGEGIFEKADAGKEWKLAPDFLQYPREVELLPYAQDALEEWLLFQEMPPAQARTTAERLPVYFGLHLHEELTRNASYYEPLLKMLKSDTAPIAQEYWAWERYRAELIREPARPLFDEAFGLDAVFVPLRAKWMEKPRGNRGEEPKEHEVNLEEALFDWWANGKKEDGLRVLSGDPGSGKSSCAKMWAAQLAERDLGWRVVFVPLHDFGFKGDLRESLKTFLKDKKRITADLLDPLSKDNTLLFFDGLDELAMQGRFSREAAVDFVREMTNLLSGLNRDSRRVLVVLGGRQLVVQDCENILHKQPHQVLHLEAYFDAERTLWWQKYGAASGKGYSDGVPTELQRPDLNNLTEQPLFNYLLALSYGREESEKRPRLDFTKHVTVNAIYEDLMESVYYRVWGDGGNVQLRGLISPDEFQELLEEIGVAVWHSDSRSATLETLRQRCETADLSDALQKLQSQPDAGVFLLLTAFHFRFTEGRESSVEFTHKSFGEYFAARRIVRLVQTICAQRELRKKQRGFGWDTTQALVQWAKLCGPQSLDATDANLFQLLTNEVRAKKESERDAWRTVLTEMIDEMATQGMPMEQCGLPTYKEMDIQARNAETTVLTCEYLRV